DRQAALLIERQAVGARLTVLTDVHTAVAAFGHEDRQLTVLGPAVDQVVVGIAKEQITVSVLGAWHPNGSLREQESPSEFFDLCVHWHDLIQGWVFAYDVRRSLADCDFWRFVEVKGSRLDPDEVLRAERNRAVNAEYRELNLLAGLRVAGENDAIGRV